jgi:hypothetical protein
MTKVQKYWIFNPLSEIQSCWIFDTVKVSTSANNKTVVERGIKLLTHQKMSSTHQKSTITAAKMIKKYFCVLTHQNNFIS